MSWRRRDDPHNPENRVAGNGGDVVKHVVYGALLDVLLAHSPWRDGLQLRECHAGRAAYRIPPDDDRRRLRAALSAGDNPWTGAQRRALTALGLPLDGSWYAGSAALLATRLAEAPGAHGYEGYEWAPDTRAIARAALAEAVGDGLPVHFPDEGHGERLGSGRFDGEMHIARSLAEWDARNVILLDPFGLWRRPKLATRRARFRAILDAYLGRGTAAPPLALFFVWSNDEAGEDDMAGEGPRVADGYRELRTRLLSAGQAPLLVRWRWDLACAMWVVVPEQLREPLHEALEQELGRVAQLATAGGVGPDALDIGML